VVAALINAIDSKPGFWSSLGKESSERAPEAAPNVFEGLDAATNSASNGHSVPATSPETVQS
jgi:hypothetical protein